MFWVTFLIGLDQTCCIGSLLVYIVICLMLKKARYISLVMSYKLYHTSYEVSIPKVYRDTKTMVS